MIGRIGKDKWLDPVQYKDLDMVFTFSYKGYLFGFNEVQDQPSGTMVVTDLFTGWCIDIGIPQSEKKVSPTKVIDALKTVIDKKWEEYVKLQGTFASSLVLSTIGCV